MVPTRRVQLVEVVHSQTATSHLSSYVWIPSRSGRTSGFTVPSTTDCSRLGYVVPDETAIATARAITISSETSRCMVGCERYIERRGNGSHPASCLIRQLAGRLPNMEGFLIRKLHN